MQSDPDVHGGLTELFGQPAAQHLFPERIVRNVVVTIDNVTREQMALNQRPIQPTSGDFITAGPEDALVLAPENYARYEPFVALVLSMDAKTLVSLYRGLEPLFQQSYEELGHPERSFNDRLIEVIDHLLQTPNPQGEIPLVQPSVLYRYADERLEKLSVGPEASDPHGGRERGRDQSEAPRDHCAELVYERRLLDSRAARPRTRARRRRGSSPSPDRRRPCPTGTRASPCRRP